MQAEIDQWFIREILPHEGALMRFLLRHWPHHDDLSDLRQELYTRIYEAASRALPHDARAFLFASARHLLTDRLRRARVVSIEPMGDLYPSLVPVDEVSPERWCSNRQSLWQLAHALDALPERCREVVWLRRVEDLSQKEVAARLGISEKTVEKHIAKAMRLLADALLVSTEDADIARIASRRRRPGSGYDQA
ncbi:RNA polymerase sigma factor [Thermomonas hydrothermalis]|uniref:RNA polymerase sigma-70 factor, ECF subfamily n=1 Tax=Thermomonas hydrothermalis TaxID=213588 RepID=A0A1M4VTS5_9GAMM|nr:sigma-70 family RNA polymerase sigma factor [Thermomonas hydrothermalis]SHE72203.1 RNA polymerase sigma-70 factor, ECF subfamily [Thermomonas hydrothermalis]